MVNAAKFRRSFRAAPYASEAKRTMSVLENLPSLIDRPRRSRRTTPSRRGRHHHRRSRRPPELHRPPRTGNHKKGIGDGAAGDLTIVRRAAAAPPRRPEPVEPVGRPAPPRSGAAHITTVRRADRPSSIVRPEPEITKKESATAPPATSPSCGERQLHHPGAPSRSSP